MRVTIATAVLVLLSSVGAFCQCVNRIDGPPNFHIRTVQIEGLEPLPATEASALRSSIERLCFSNANELGERARDLFQQHGYFKAAVDNPRLVVKDDHPWPAAADVLLVVNPGVQYRLREITFSGNKSVNNRAALRALFPLADGDLLDVSKVRSGIKRMKDAYGELAFIDFTPIPNFIFDDREKLATLHVDVDEGKQFTVEQVDIRAPAKDVNKLTTHWYLRTGDLYNSRAVALFFEKNRRLLSPGMTADRNVELREDRNNATVVVHVNVCGEAKECRQVHIPCRDDVVCEEDAAGIPRFVRLRNQP